MEEVPVNERNVDDMYHSSMRQSTIQNPYVVESNRLRDIIDQNNEQIQMLRKELNFRIAKEKPYANDLNLLKQKLNEVLLKPPLSRRNTPIENPEWLQYRIEELEKQKQEENQKEEQKEEQIELKIHS